MPVTSRAVTRRGALTGFGAAGVSALAAPALAQDVPRVIRMATSFPPALGGIGHSGTRSVEMINRCSGGRLAVEMYGPGELVGALDVHDAVAAGDVDAYHSCEYYFQRKHRGFNFFTTVPLGLTVVEQGAWIHHGGGQALWDELSAGFGVRAMASGGTGVQMGGWFNKEITSVEDFRGLTMRMPGLGAQVISALGATSVSLPGGGIVEALFDGSIDATEWVGPYNDLHFGFQKLLSNYIYPGFHEPGTVTSLGFNLDLWNDLEPVDRALIETVAEAEFYSHTADYYGNNGLALAQLIAESGARPQRLPDEVWDVLARTAFEITAGVAQDGELAARIVESYEAFRALAGNAGPISQSEYLARRGAADLFGAAL